MTRIQPKINRILRVVTKKPKVENTADCFYGSHGERTALHPYIHLRIKHSFKKGKTYYVQSLVPGAADTAVNKPDKVLLLWNLPTIFKRRRH